MTRRREGAQLLGRLAPQRSASTHNWRLIWHARIAGAAAKKNDVSDWNCPSGLNLTAAGGKNIVQKNFIVIRGITLEARAKTFGNLSELYNGQHPMERFPIA